MENLATSHNQSWVSWKPPNRQMEWNWQNQSEPTKMDLKFHVVCTHKGLGWCQKAHFCNFTLVLPTSFHFPIRLLSTNPVLFVTGNYIFLGFYPFQEAGSSFFPHYSGDMEGVFLRNVETFGHPLHKDSRQWLILPFQKHKSEVVQTPLHVKDAKRASVNEEGRAA